MHILIITQFFWPETFRLNDFAVGLVSRGQKVTVLTGFPNYPDGVFFRGYGLFKKYNEQYKGIRIRRVPIIPRGKGGAYRLVLNYASFAFSVLCFLPFLHREKYDMVLFSLSPLAEGIVVNIFKKIRKIPAVFWVQDLWPESLSATGVIRSHVLLHIVRKFIRLIYNGCDCILIQSRAFRRYVEEFGVPSKKIHYFPNSAETLYNMEYLEPNATSNLDMPTGFRVMFAGNIGAAQDFDNILLASQLLRDYKDIHWIILGKGRKFESVEQKIKSFGLEDTFHLLGRRPVETMPHFFSLADAMLVTLRSNPIFTLTIPAKIQSYLACGRPIIAALEGEGAKIVIEAGAGIVCSSSRPELLAESVLSMYKKTDSERAEMGRKGREYFEKNFDRNILLDQFLLHMSELKSD